MSILTPFFNLFKLEKSDPYHITQFNENMDIIDTELHKPPLTVNEISPNPITRNIPITTVPLADNLTSDEAQVNTGTYIIRSSGGEASIKNGPAWLTTIKGGQVKTGYQQQSIVPTVSEGLDVSIDEAAFVAEASNSGTYTFTYTTDWNVDPATYGITVTGTPALGDQIIVVYVKENRGTITTASPTSFVSTGWNLYNNTVGYARVVKYSEEYGFMIDGTYSGLKFAETLDGEQTTITPVNGFFTVPSDGYVFVTGGNATNTMIWMTWSDWTEQPNGGVFQAYSQTSIDLTGIMVNFPDGLMRIDNYYDEINLNVSRAYSRIEKMDYTQENLDDVIARGVPYDTDTGYIYAVRDEPVTYVISLEGEYTVSDHGEEMFLGTTVPVTASSLYGNDLKGKLRRDVLTISEQELTPAQKTQVLSNIGAASASALSSGLALVNSAITSATTFSTGTPSSQTAKVTDRGSSCIKMGKLVIVNIECEVAESVGTATTLYTIPSGFRPSSTVGSFYAIGKTASGDIVPRNGSSFFTINSSGNVVQKWSGTYSGWFAALFIYAVS